MIWKKLLGVFWFAAGLIIGIGCARIWFALYPRPGPASPPAPAQVVVSPPVPSRPPAATIRGQASGTARRIRASTRPQEARSGGGEDIITPAPEITTPPAEPVAVQGGTPAPSPAPIPAPSPEPAFMVGERAEGTVQGEIEIVDTRGRPLTTEPLQVEGDYSLEFPGPGEAELSLRFESPAVFEVHEPARAIRLGASAGWMADRPFAAVSAEYERRWNLIGDLAARAAVEAGWAWTPERDGPIVRMEAGIEYRF